MFKTFLMLTVCAGLNLAVGNVVLGGLFLVAQGSCAVVMMLDGVADLAREMRK